MSSSRREAGARRGPQRRAGRGERTPAALSPANLARTREAAYRLFAVTLLPPDAQTQATVSAAAGALEEAGRDLTGLAIFGRWMSLLRMLRGAEGEDIESLQADYASLFGVAAAGCPPYESHYVTVDAAEARVAAAVERAYETVGFHLNETLGQPPDHAAVELAFMAGLCDREAAALEAGRPEEAVPILASQQHFLTQHLGRWFPRFARNMARSNRRGFYDAVVETAAAFIHHDADLISLLLGFAQAAGRLPEKEPGAAG